MKSPPIIPMLILTVLLIAEPSDAGADIAGSAYLGFAKAMDKDAPDGSFSGRINTFAMVNSGVGLGAEVGYLGLGKAEGGSLGTWQFTGCGIVKSELGKFRGFGTGGLGFYVLDPPVDGGSSQFGFNLGGGFSFHPKPAGKVSLGMDFRYHAVVNVGVSNETLDIFALMAGVNYNY